MKMLLTGNKKAFQTAKVVSYKRIPEGIEILIKRTGDKGGEAILFLTNEEIEGINKTT